jgi:NAD(P)H dehydrogenase (quinone)
MTTSETIAVTGATGQLGRLVIADLLARAPAARIVALVRNPAAARDIADRGVELRAADYDDPTSVKAALSGIDRLLLISSSEIGKRAAQHGNVIDAAKAAGVRLIAYTSLLHADTSPMALAAEHRATEALIRASGVPFVILRNGWYTENYTGNVAAVLQHGAVLGSAQNGRISAAARADFAGAAAAVLASRDSHAGTIYELAGDAAFTLSDYAAEIARQSGKAIVYKNLPEAEYKSVLQGVGLPEAFADIIAESDAKAANDSLYDAGRQLSRLIGRPTTTMAQSVAAALAR